MTTAASPTLRTHVALSSGAALRYSVAALRFGLGALFSVAGADGFLHFLPQPTGPMPEGAVALATALMASGYLFPLIKATELVAGLLLLTNRWVPLALTILAPVLVNIVAFNVFLVPAGLPMAVMLLGAELFLAWSYREAFRPLLRARAARTSG